MKLQVPKKYWARLTFAFPRHSVNPNTSQQNTHLIPLDLNWRPPRFVLLRSNQVSMCFQTVGRIDPSTHPSQMSWLELQSFSTSLLFFCIALSIEKKNQLDPSNKFQASSISSRLVKNAFEGTSKIFLILFHREIFQEHFFMWCSPLFSRHLSTRRLVYFNI